MIAICVVAHATSKLSRIRSSSGIKFCSAKIFNFVIGKVEVMLIGGFHRSARQACLLCVFKQSLNVRSLPSPQASGPVSVSEVKN